MKLKLLLNFLFPKNEKKVEISNEVSPAPKVNSNSFKNKTSQLSPRKKYIGIADAKTTRNFIQNYYSQYISKGLKSKLESAYSAYLKDIDNPLVITVIKYREEGEQILLIAKKPNDSLYYGIMEGKFIITKQVREITASEICNLEFKEFFINPFRANQYIESGIKQFNK